MRVIASGLACLSMLCATVASAPASHAQTADDPLGLTAGTFLLRGRLVGIFPDNRDNSITVIGGHTMASNSITPEVDLSYFFTNHIAIEAETGVTHSTLTAEHTAFGDSELGKVWGAPVVALLQYHFLPLARWNPYAGVGVAFLPYFDAQPAGGLVRQLSVKSEVGVAFQVGIDVRIKGQWYGNLDVKQLLVSSYSSVDDGTISSSGHISPLVVGFGIGYRF